MNVAYIQALVCYLRFLFLYRHMHFTNVQDLECYLRSDYLYRHLTVTYIQALESHLRSHFLYRHLNVIYIQALEYYLRSHYSYTHLSLTCRCKTPESTTYTGVWVTLYSHSLYRRWSVTLFPIHGTVEVLASITMKAYLRLFHEILLYSISAEPR